QETRRNADRLREVFGEAKILVVIRSQINIVESFYKQYLRWGGIADFNAFLDGGWRSHIDFRPSHVDYVKLLKCYQSVFGRESVKVMLYEKLAEDPQKFADEVCGYLGCRPIELGEAAIRSEN